jgi:hypothetical protein
MYVGPLSSTQRRRLSSHPKSVAPVLDEAKREWLRAIVHESPRSFGKHTRLWTLRLLAEVCFEQGVTSRALSSESMRGAFKRMGAAWRRAKHWITSPDPRYALKKAARRLIRWAAAYSEWVLGFADELWWSRLAQPDLQAWAEDKPVRLREMTSRKRTQIRRLSLVTGSFEPTRRR